MFELSEISQGIKIFDLFKSLIRKPFQTFYCSLRNSFEKTRFQNTILDYFKSYASIFAKEILYKIIYIK
jgi:hypothetical protein